jgi:hypothetical protein
MAKAIDTEMGQLCKLLAKPLATYTPQDISGFGFEGLQLQRAAPLLHQILMTVVVRRNPEEAGEEDNTQLLRPRNKPMMVEFGMSMLAYARSKNANLVQGNMGYFLNAASTGKRAIEVLHRLGVSICYESVLRVEKVGYQRSIE